MSFSRQPLLYRAPLRSIYQLDFRSCRRENVSGWVNDVFEGVEENKMNSTRLEPKIQEGKKFRDRISYGGWRQIVERLYGQLEECDLLH